MPEGAIVSEYANVSDPFTNLGSDTTAAMIDATWLSDDVARLVRSQLTLAELPYLADALEEAGCTDDAMLLHLRHAHGQEAWPFRLCCVVDGIRRKLAVLGRIPPPTSTGTKRAPAGS